LPHSYKTAAAIAVGNSQPFQLPQSAFSSAIAHLKPSAIMTAAAAVLSSNHTDIFKSPNRLCTDLPANQANAVNDQQQKWLTGFNGSIKQSTN
jgi:hypothetical protein